MASRHHQFHQTLIALQRNLKTIEKQKANLSILSTSLQRGFVFSGSVKRGMTVYILYGNTNKHVRVKFLSPEDRSRNLLTYYMYSLVWVPTKLFIDVVSCFKQIHQVQMQ